MDLVAGEGAEVNAFEAPAGALAVDGGADLDAVGAVAPAIERRCHAGGVIMELDLVLGEGDVIEVQILEPG